MYYPNAVTPSHLHKDWNRKGLRPKEHFHANIKNDSMQFTRKVTSPKHAPKERGRAQKDNNGAAGNTGGERATQSKSPIMSHQIWNENPAHFSPYETTKFFQHPVKRNPPHSLRRCGTAKQWVPVQPSGTTTRLRSPHRKPRIEVIHRIITSSQPHLPQSLTPPSPFPPNELHHPNPRSAMPTPTPHLTSLHRYKPRKSTPWDDTKREMANETQSVLSRYQCSDWDGDARSPYNLCPSISPSPPPYVKMLVDEQTAMHAGQRAEERPGRGGNVEF